MGLLIDFKFLNIGELSTKLICNRSPLRKGFASKVYLVIRSSYLPSDSEECATKALDYHGRRLFGLSSV